MLRIIKRAPRYRASDEACVAAPVDKVDLERGVVFGVFANLIEHFWRQHRVVDCTK
jgi:hypothetical protein